MHLDIFCSTYFLKKIAGCDPLNWFHNPVMGHNPRGEKRRVSSLLRTAANTGQVAPSRHHPLGSLKNWCIMAPAVMCPWWWSTWWCSALSVEAPFRGPVGHTIKRPWSRMPSQCYGRRLKSVKCSRNLKDASSVSGITGLYISSLLMKLLQSSRAEWGSSVLLTWQGYE